MRSIGARKAMENTLWNLRAIRKDGCDDNGRPLSDEALAELDADIAGLERKLGQK